jgi:integrase
VPKLAGLIRRDGGYTLRVVIPKSAQAAFALIWDRLHPDNPQRAKSAIRKQLWIALGTSDRREAIKAANLKRVWLDGLFEEAGSVRAPAPNPPSASKAAINRAVREYFYNLEKLHEPVPFDHYAREDLRERAIEEAGGIHGTPDGDRYVTAVVNELATAARLSLENIPLLRLYMREAVKAAMDEHATREVERLSLHPVAKRHQLFADITPATPPALITPPEKALTLSEAVDEYKADPGRAERAPKTKMAYEHFYAVWICLLGADKPVASITRDEIRSARDMLLRLPPNATKRWPGMPLSKVAELAKRENTAPLHPKTATSYLNYLASLFNWLEAEGKIAKNPATRLAAPAVQKGDKSRRPFTVAELQRLFDANPYDDPTAPRGFLFWLPLLALFHGCRQAELAGLQASDIESLDGVSVINIRWHKGRRLKNDQSERIIPVHPTVKQLGFLEWVKSQPATGPLFADQPGKAPLYAPTQRALMRSIRLVFPKDGQLVFHSLRHTWQDAMRNAYIPPAIAERLGGWHAAGASASVGYGAGFRPSILYAEIAKVNFEGLDISHLIPIPLSVPAGFKGEAMAVPKGQVFTSNKPLG